MARALLGALPCHLARPPACGRSARHGTRLRAARGRSGSSSAILVPGERWAKEARHFGTACRGRRPPRVTGSAPQGASPPWGSGIRDFARTLFAGIGARMRLRTEERRARSDARSSISFPSAPKRFLAKLRWRVAMCLSLRDARNDASPMLQRCVALLLRAPSLSLQSFSSSGSRLPRGPKGRRWFPAVSRARTSVPVVPSKPCGGAFGQGSPTYAGEHCSFWPSPNKAFVALGPP